MLGNIQTYFFFSLIHTKRCKDSDDCQTNQCADNCNRRSHHNTDDLRQQEMIIAIDKTIPAGHTVDRALGKETGSNAAFSLIQFFDTITLHSAIQLIFYLHAAF